MKLVRKTLLVAVVWLTAAGTLLAGMPHPECICLGGQRKVERQAATPSAGCCCGSGCCSNEGACPFCGKQPEPTSAQTDDAASPTSAVKPSPCQRTIAHNELVATPSAKAQENPTTSLVPSVLSATLLAPAAVPHVSRTHRIHLLPPPTDLVTLLQHFVI